MNYSFIQLQPLLVRHRLLSLCSLEQHCVPFIATQHSLKDPSGSISSSCAMFCIHSYFPLKAPKTRAHPHPNTHMTAHIRQRKCAPVSQTSPKAHAPKTHRPCATKLEQAQPLQGGLGPGQACGHPAGPPLNAAGQVTFAAALPHQPPPPPQPPPPLPQCPHGPYQLHRHPCDPDQARQRPSCRSGYRAGSSPQLPRQPPAQEEPPRWRLLQSRWPCAGASAGAGGVHRP